ncbi:MAG TPA: carboxylesterase family protein [Opitutaceae bacterium]
MKITPYIIFALCAVGLTAAEKTAPVPTEYGPVQGLVENGLSIFKGIPFAAPPVGDRRWRAPQPPQKWVQPRAAEKFANDPFQGNGTQPDVGEDCLYLNIWSPAKSPNDRVPVLVWIYGGGFSFGSTATPVHDGEHLARKGVVLVTINYRVGTLGFLAHPELDQESPAHVSGNYGLQDMIAGLQWVKKNIAAFGGDPNQVTIFGESAGGIAVSMLCASPEAKNLFQGAISQSGGSFGPTRPTTYPGENMKRLAEAEQAGLEYAKKAGVASIAELRKIPPEKLPPSWGSGAAWPIIDGRIIVDDQYKLYSAGKYNVTPILIGYNSDEGLSFTYDKTPADYKASAKKRFGPFAERLLQAYPAGETTISRSARNLARDAAFGWPTWTWARLQAHDGKAKVYLYLFDQHPDHAANTPEADHGTPHGVDVPYVFQTLQGNQKTVTPSDLVISEAMATYWTNFAKRGNPNGSGLPEWPEFTDQDHREMHFHDTPEVGSVPDEAGLKVLDEYFAWRRTPEGEKWAQ